MRKVINRPPVGGKKEEAEKKKEQSRCVCTGRYSQHRARVRTYLRVRGWTKHRLYDEAGAAADEITATCFGSPADHNKWAARMYQYPWAIEEFREMAHEKASCERAGELRDALTAFQCWINKHYPNPKKGGAK